jgi:hypothetical protein
LHCDLGFWPMRAHTTHTRWCWCALKWQVKWCWPFVSWGGGGGTFKGGSQSYTPSDSLLTGVKRVHQTGITTDSGCVLETGWHLACIAHFFQLDSFTPSFSLSQRYFLRITQYRLLIDCIFNSSWNSFYSWAVAEIVFTNMLFYRKEVNGSSKRCNRFCISTLCNLHAL